MPFAKIHVLETSYDEARLDRVSNAIQRALATELGASPDELFQIIHLLQAHQFRHTRSFLGLNYSDDLIWLELTLIAGRLPKEKRLNLLKALNAGVVDAAQISPDDLLVDDTKRKRSRRIVKLQNSVLEALRGLQNKRGTGAERTAARRMT